MNRMKKEHFKQYNAAREGLTPAQVQALDAQDRYQELIHTLAKSMHSRWFSEEFDFCYDSKSDAADRKKGINPMREEYIANIAKKRQQQGVSPLNEAGLATSQETFELCLAQATNRIDQLVCRIDEVLFYIWDPIGVSDSNLPRDEYSRYTEQAFELALAHSSHTPLANYLTELVTEHIGMPENKAHDAKVAELIYSIVHDVEYIPDMTVVVVE